jgi:hypothetical protein
MRALDSAAVGIARGITALEGAGKNLARRSLATPDGDSEVSASEGDVAVDMVTLSTSLAQVRANVVLARTAAETEKHLVDVFA